MKSKTVKLIFTALAFCLLISILAMGALATGNDTAEPTNSDTSSTPEPEKVTVSFTVEGYQYINGVRVTVDGYSYTGYLGSNGSYSVSVEKGSSVSITVTPKDGYKVNTPTASGWTVSEGTLETMREYGYRGEVRIIPNGSDLKPLENTAEAVQKAERLCGVCPEDTLFLFVGQHIPQKT